MEGYGNFGSEERLTEEVTFKVYVKDKSVLNEGLSGNGLAKCGTLENFKETQHFLV